MFMHKVKLKTLLVSQSLHERFRFSFRKLHRDINREGRDEVYVKEQTVNCVIGCNDDERLRRQDIKIGMRVWTDLPKSSIPLSEYILQAKSSNWKYFASKELASTHNYSSVAKISKQIAEEGNFFTIEALAECIAKTVLDQFKVPLVEVTVEKPGALVKRGAIAAGVVIQRSAHDYD